MPFLSMKWRDRGGRPLNFIVNLFVGGIIKLGIKIWESLPEKGSFGRLRWREFPYNCSSFLFGT